MTVVNSKEFITNQKKYFDLALNEQVFIKRGKNTFHLICTNMDNTTGDEMVYNEPDEDFRRAISSEEFRKRLIVVLDRVDKKYANRCK